MKLLAFILFLFVLPVHAVWDLSGQWVTNDYNWNEHTGIPGGIPHRTTIHATLSPGATAANINSAISGAASNTVVFLEAGTYNISSSILFGSKSGVTLRGATNASGVPTTIITLSGSASAIESNSGALDFTGAANLSSGYTKGSTSIVFSATPDSQVAVGNLIAITGADVDGEHFTTAGSLGRNRESIHIVTAKSGTTVEFYPPLFISFTSDDSPQAEYLGSGPGARWCGVEDVIINMDSGNYGFDGWGCYAFWFRNVYMNNIGDSGVFFYGSANCEVRHSYIHDANGTPNNPDGYGVQFREGTSFCKVEDNIFEKVFTSHWTINGGMGNSFAFNFATNMTAQGLTTQVPSIRSNHGGTPIGMLYEGNVGEGFQAEGYHGNDAHAILFRNWFHGLSTTGTGHRIMVDLSRGAYYYVVVGNVLGDASWSGPGTFQYELSGNPGNSDQSVMYRIGYPNTYNHSFTADPAWSLFSGSYPDAKVASTLLRHGNYDHVNEAIVNADGEDTTLPNSLLYASKPAYFGTLGWPAYDPANPSAVNATNIPAGHRFVLGEDPPAEGGGESGGGTGGGGVVGVTELRVGTIEVAP